MPSEINYFSDSWNRVMPTTQANVIPITALPTITEGLGAVTGATSTVSRGSAPSLQGIILDIKDALGNLKYNVMRGLSYFADSYPQGRPISEYTLISPRPVEVPDVTRMNFKIGPFEITRRKKTSTTTNSSKTPESDNNSEDKPEEKTEQPSNPQNPKDPKNKKSKAVKWGLIMGGEQAGGSIFDAIATNAARKKARQEGIDYQGEHVSGLPWYTPLGALHGLYELTVDTKKENIIQEAKNQAKSDTTTNKQSTSEVKVETPKKEEKDSIINLSPEERARIKEMFGSE